MKIALLLLLMVSGLWAQRSSLDEGLRLYNANCATCHGTDGDLIAGAEIRSGQFRRAANDTELARVLTNGIPGTPMPATSLTAPQIAAVIAYLRSPRETPARSVSSGDAVRGRAIFQGTGCLSCHQVHGTGSHVGPDLSNIGAIRSVTELERSIIDPNAVVLPQNRFIRATTREGVLITGRRLNEDTLTVQLIDSNERLVSLNKVDLREYVVEKTSRMPAFKDKLNPQQVADLVSYLMSLKGSDAP